jgi:hypothetical protein
MRKTGDEQDRAVTHTVSVWRSQHSKTPNLLPVKHVAKLLDRVGEIEPE